MTTKTKKTSFLLILLYVVYFLYYFADMNTSANTMVKQTESRSDVHLYLIVLIALLGVYFLSRGKWYLEDPFRLSFLFMIVWTVVVDVIVGSAFWGIATHVGLLVLFYLIYFWGAVYIDTAQRYNLVIWIECSLWALTIWFAVQAYMNFRDYRGDDVDVVLNMAYNVLVFMPVLLQIKNRPLKFATVGISTIYIVASLKRGAIVTMLVMLAAHVLSVNKKKRKTPLQINLGNVGRMLLAFGSAVAIIVLVNNAMDGALSARFSMEALQYGSARNEIYAAAWNDIKMRSVMRLLVGKGSGSSLQIIGSGVHNEILEFLFSYGIIGLVLYITVLGNGIKRATGLRVVGTTKSDIFTMGLTYLALVGVFGSALFSHMSFHIMLAMGMANSAGCEIADGRLPDGQQ